MRLVIAAIAAAGPFLGLTSDPLHAAEAAAAQSSQPVLLDEISDQNAPTLPCSLATCGTVISIAPIQGNADIQPTENAPPPMVVGDDPGAVITDPALDPILAAPGATAYVVGDLGPVWQIRVRMQDGAVQSVLQSFQPLFQVGDVVVVENRSIRLWP